MTKLFTAILATLSFTYAVQGKSFTLQAASDFKHIESGEAPFYKDARCRALAINSGNRMFRDKWADANTSFSGDPGKYDITITTLTEVDGESSYRLLINGKEAGTFQNPETKKDYACATHTWSKITLNTGDKITVSAKAHTNGKIPERDGSAWARGRWRTLKFEAAE